MTENPVAAAQVEDDPARPYKAIAGFAAPAVLAFLQALLDDGKAFLPPWGLLLLGALMAAVATFVAKNPKRVKGEHRRR